MDQKERVKETLRRAAVFGRHHLDLLAAEKSITDEELMRIVNMHTRTIAQVSPGPVDIAPKSKLFRSKSKYNEVALVVLSGIIKTIEQHKPLTTTLATNNSFFKDDD